MHCVSTRPSPTDNAPKIFILKAIVDSISGKGLASAGCIRKINNYLDRYIDIWLVLLVKF